MKKPLVSFLAGFTIIFLMALTTDQIMQKVYDSSNTALRVNLVAGGGGSGNAPTGCTNTDGNPISCPGFKADSTNDVTMSGATTGNAPTLTITGSDQDIGLLIKPKYTAATNGESVVVGATNIPSALITFTGGVPGIWLNSYGNNFAGLIGSYAAARNPGLLATASSGGTPTAPTKVVSGDFIGEWDTYGYNDTDAAFNYAGQIVLAATADWTGAGIHPAEMLFNIGSTTQWKISSTGLLQSTGSATAIKMLEVSAPSGVASNDLLYADSTAHRLVMNNNNGGAKNVVASGVDINTSDQVTATHLAAALPVAQGGTALTSGTSGGILGYTASGTLASSGALTANTLIKGGGAGATPAVSAITDDGSGAIGWYPAAAAPQAVTQTFASVVAGTTDTAGAATTTKLSASTGTGVGGTWSIQNTNKAGTGSTVNTYGNVLTLSPPNSGTTAPVNYFDIKNAITTVGPTLAATGTDSNVPLTISSKASGTINITVPSNGVILMGGSSFTGLRSSNTPTANSVTVGTADATSGQLGFISGTATGNPDAFFARAGAASIQMGYDATGSTSQTFGIANSTGGTDSAGATFTLAGSTGSGAGVPGRIHMTTSSLLGTGTTQQTKTDRLIVGAEKALTNNSVTAIVNATAANNTVAALQATYSCQVFNGTDLQIEEGEIVAHVTNKGNSLANNTVVKYGNQQAMTSGTLTVTWTITAANPAVLSVNCNSSLTPSTGFPKLRYTLQNLTDQAVAVQ